MALILRMIVNRMEYGLQKQYNSRIDDILRSQNELHESSIGLLHNEYSMKEQAIRKDSSNKSRSVRIGNTVEKIIPVSGMIGYDPEDMVFIGRPVDYIVFEGMRDDNIKNIVLLEVKTGSSVLSKREKQVRECIMNNKTVFKEVRIDNK
ncbi:MAG: Holliday junction resolvase-like protein [Candidatus Woesearchaeota archaeon]